MHNIMCNILHDNHSGKYKNSALLHIHIKNKQPVLTYSFPYQFPSVGLVILRATVTCQALEGWMLYRDDA